MNVAPFTGAWIEISQGIATGASNAVAPFTGAWIEITLLQVSDESCLSLPSRGRGLKYGGALDFIEKNGRSLHGGVD